MNIAGEIRRRFVDAGVRGWLHACPVSADGQQVEVDADDVVPMASVYKLPLLVAFLRAVDDQAIDPVERIELRPADRTPGPTGISALHDSVILSWRDLMTSAVAVSDNAAADAVLARLGAERVAEAIQSLGLTATTVTGGTAEAFRGLQRDTGTPSVSEALDALADPDRVLEPSGYDPLRTSASTPRDMTRLLVALWTDRAASAEQCRFARESLAKRFGPDRLRSGFALDGVELADKTGTLGALRHDVGVVRFAGEPAYAVAVFTRAGRPDRLLPAAEAVIGVTARLAVDHLRLS